MYKVLDPKTESTRVCEHSVKSQIINILGIKSHAVSVAASQLYIAAQKWP